MAWTAPRTWTDGELVTKAIMDPHIRDNFLAVGPHLLARKTADQSVTSSTVLVSDTHLTFSIGSSEAWRLEFHLLVTGAGAGDLKVAYSVPAGCTTYRNYTGPDAAATVVAAIAADTTGGADRLTHDIGIVDATGNPYVIHVHAINGGTAGSVTLRWAQNVSNGTATTLKTNSTLWGVKLA